VQTLVVVVTHASLIAVPLVWDTGGDGIAIEPIAASIAIAIRAVLAGPPTDSNANEPVIEVMAMVVVGELVVGVTMTVVAANYCRAKWSHHASDSYQRHECHRNVRGSGHHRNVLRRCVPCGEMTFR
jgi:hypothetical protein